MDRAEAIIRELSAENSRDRMLRKITGAAQIADFFFNPEYHTAQKRTEPSICQQEYRKF